MSKHGRTRAITKNSKSNKNEDHEQVRDDPSFSAIPEWLQEFTQNLVDERVSEHRGSHASSSNEPSLEPQRRVVPGKHSIHTHFPKDRDCEICQRTKTTRPPCRRRIGGVVPRAENVGDLITADHKVLSEGCESRKNQRYAVVVQDLATNWIQPYPCKTKTSQETHGSLQKFLEPDRKPKVIYTDNSFEFGKACEDLSWNHCTSTPHRSETDGIAERAVRRVKEGTSAVLLQSGLNESWWADSMERYTYLRNVTDLLSDGKTSYERRFEKPFKGPIIPFGSLVEYHPITAKDQSKNQSIWKESAPRNLSRLCLVRGRNVERRHTGRGPWGAKRDGRIGNPCWKIPRKRCDIAEKWWKLQIASDRWNSKTFRKRPGTENIHLDTESTSSRKKSSRVPWRFRSVFNNILFSRLVSGCRWSTRWFLVHVRKLQKPPSRCTKRQTPHAEGRIISCSTKIYWRHQGHSYNLRRIARNPHRWLLEHWWSKRFVWFLDRFHTIYFIEEKTSRLIHVVRGEIDETASNIKAWSFVTRNLEKYVKEFKNEGEAKLGKWKTKAWKCANTSRNLFHWTWGWGIRRRSLKMHWKSWKSQEHLLCLVKGQLAARMEWPAAGSIIKNWN